MRINPIPTRCSAAAAAAIVLTLVLAACGSDDDTAVDAAPVPPPAAAVVSGTAAVGAALAGANVSVIDVARTSVCAEATIVTSPTGGYICTVLAGKTAPFVVTVVDPSDAYAPMVSVASSVPAAGSTLIVNATPLTTAIVAQLAPNGEALALAANPALVNIATLTELTGKVLAQLAPALTALGALPGYNPFSTQIVPATLSQPGNTADGVLELVRVSTVNGVTLLSTVDNPAGAVPIATAGAATPTPLPTPSRDAVSLANALRLLAGALERCFALPVATRVVTKDDAIAMADGGPSVTVAATDCNDLAHGNYLHNGYRGGQAFYGLLNDANMVGARFNPPELMLFIDDTTAANNDRAIVNLRFTDRNGIAINVITVAQKFPGTSTGRATDWWLYGNQQAVDSSIQAFVRRSEQLAPNAGVAPFANAGNSRFESGFNIFVNKDGPGSRGLRAARITGPGLPPAGLVQTRPAANIVTNQNWLNIRRKDGNTDSAAATRATDVGNIFGLQRTLGLSGANATTVRSNPNGGAGNTNNTAFPAWAHPLDYGAAPGATDYIDFATLRANTAYRFEFFYDGETAPRYSYDKTLLTPVVPATRGGNLQWITLGPATLGYLDPANALAGAQASMNLAWVANPLAETIRSAGVYVFGAGLNVDQALVSVTRGATSAVATAPAGAAGGFPVLTNDGSSWRLIQLRYRVVDGSFKDSFTRFN